MSKFKTLNSVEEIISHMFSEDEIKSFKNEETFEDVNELVINSIENLTSFKPFEFDGFKYVNCNDFKIKELILDHLYVCLISRIFEVEIDRASRIYEIAKKEDNYEERYLDGHQLDLIIKRLKSIQNISVID